MGFNSGFKGLKVNLTTDLYLMTRLQCLEFCLHYSLHNSKSYRSVKTTFILKAPNAFFVTGTNRNVISDETKSYALVVWRSKLCSRIRLVVALSAVSVHRVRTDVTQPANKAFHRVQRCPTDLLPDQKLASVCSRV